MTHTYKQYTVLDNQLILLIDPEVESEEAKALKTARDHGLYIPDQSKLKADLERQKFAKETGTIVAMGVHAFEGMNEPKPMVGDRVVFARYTGKDLQKPDEEGKNQLRIIPDSDILVIIREERKE